MVCVVSHVTAAGSVILGQYYRVREKMNEESRRTCKQRGHCSCAWGLSPGVDSSPGSGWASPTTLALVPLTWAVPFSVPADHLRTTPQGCSCQQLSEKNVSPTANTCRQSWSSSEWMLCSKCNSSFHPACFTAADFLWGPLLHTTVGD